MDKQYLDKEGLQIVTNNIKEAKEVAAGAMALAQEAIDELVPSPKEDSDSESDLNWYVT